jgi:5-methyltetrahydrofolate corrinoid/iron sulfur protein methyltransferase
VMDGEDVDLGSLTKEQVNYAKTTKVLMGNILYSDSWLEL